MQLLLHSVPHGPILKQLCTESPGSLHAGLSGSWQRAGRPPQRSSGHTAPHWSGPQSHRCQFLQITQGDYCTAFLDTPAGTVSALASVPHFFCLVRQHISRQAATLGDLPMVHLQHLWRQQLKHLLPALCRCAAQGCPAAALGEAGGGDSPCCNAANLQMYASDSQPEALDRNRSD